MQLYYSITHEMTLDPGGLMTKGWCPLRREFGMGQRGILSYKMKGKRTCERPNAKRLTPRLQYPGADHVPDYRSPVQNTQMLSKSRRTWVSCYQ